VSFPGLTWWDPIVICRTMRHGVFCSLAMFTLTTKDSFSKAYEPVFTIVTSRYYLCDFFLNWRTVMSIINMNYIYIILYIPSKWKFCRFSALHFLSILPHTLHWHSQASWGFLCPKYLSNHPPKSPQHNTKQPKMVVSYQFSWLPVLVAFCNNKLLLIKK
jgi:hypothetical protein